MFLNIEPDSDNKSWETHPTYKNAIRNSDCGLDIPTPEDVIVPSGECGYLVNLCLSTKGATSDVLNISCKYDDVFSKSKLIYSNNHGEMTNVNFGTIIKVTAKDNGYSSFRFFLSNTGRSREELIFTTFNLSIIKLY